MGAKWLVVLRYADGARGGNFTSLMGALDALNAKDRKSWTVSAEFYRPVVPASQPRSRGSALRELCVVNFVTEQPNTVYLVHSRTKCVLESEKALLRILTERLGSYQAPNFSYKVEGVQIATGDFVLKLGKLMVVPSNEFKRLVLEIECRALGDLDEAQHVMQAFLGFVEDNISDPAVTLNVLRVNFEDFKLPADFSWQHSAVHFAVLCGTLGG